MNKQIIEIVNSYYKQIIDVEKHLRNEGYNIKYYIDAQDAIKVIKGINTYYNPNFQRDEFFSNITTVYNLIMGGWIQNLYLLPPHQGEFIDKLEGNFGIESDKDSEDFINDLYALKGKDKITISQISYRNENKTKFVSESINNANEYFNLVYTIYQHGWKKRFKTLITNKTIIIQDYKFIKLFDLVKTEEFKLLKKSIDKDKYRSKFKHSMKNFNDALALTYIYYENKETDHNISILLDSTGTFTRIIKSACLSEKFKYNNKDLNENFNFIRDANYFILKGIFDFPEDKLELIKKLLPKYYSHNYKDAISGSSVLHYSNLKKYNINYEKSIKSFIDKNNEKFNTHLKNIFFQNTWLPCFADNDTKQIIQDYFNDEHTEIEKIKNKENEDEFISNYISNYEIIKREGEIFNNLANIWRELYRIKEANEFKNFISISTKELFFFINYGLCRFSLPYKTAEYTDIKAYESVLKKLLMDEGLRSEDDTYQEIAINNIINHLFSGLINKNINDLTIGISILWILDRFYFINKLLKHYEKSGKYPHFSFALIHAASISKHSSFADDFNRVIKILEIPSFSTKEEECLIKIAKVYIYHLIWDKNHTIGTFSKNINHPNIHVDNYLELIINNINDVLRYFNAFVSSYKFDWQPIIHMYALNSKIYVTVECISSIEDFSRLYEFETIFVNTEVTYKDYWQSRYDDTLARYYLRKAFYELETNTKNYKYYLRLSRFRINKGLKNCFQDKENKQNFDILLKNIETKTIIEIKKMLKLPVN